MKIEGIPEPAGLGAQVRHTDAEPSAVEKTSARRALEHALESIRDKASYLGENWASKKARQCLEQWQSRP